MDETNGPFSGYRSYASTDLSACSLLISDSFVKSGDRGTEKQTNGMLESLESVPLARMRRASQEKEAAEQRLYTQHM
jgi:hypothetical protein